MSFSIRGGANERATRTADRITRRSSDVDELQRMKAHLGDLARSKPTAKRRSEVEALLRNKWEA